MAANDVVDNAQRFRNGLPAEATLDDKLAFATHCLQNYHVQQWSGDSLSEYFADDFGGFTKEDFKSIDSDTRRNLRDLLRSRGVFVPKGRNVLIADALHQVAQEDLPWPDEDLEKPSKQATLSSQQKQTKIGDLDEEKDNNAVDVHVARVDEVPYNTGIHPAEQSDTASRPLRRSNMANLFKAYSGDDDKYSGGTTDNFERKFLLFLERCDQADILNEDRNRAFSIMLTGHARQFYFDSLKRKNLSLVELEAAVKSRFLTPERTRALLREWEALSLMSIMSLHTSKSASSCLELLIEKLSDIQSSLPIEYRNETILKNKLLNAVKDVKDCQLAYHKPADTVQGVISDLHASLATLKTRGTEATAFEPSANFVDRRLVRNKPSKPPSTSSSKKCFVCGRPGCWSTNHSPKERLRSYRKNKSIRQFIASFENESSSDEDKEDVADAIDDIVTHFIQINGDSKDPNYEDDNHFDPKEECFSHMATLDDDDSSIAFTAQLQNVAFIHSASGSLPEPRFGEKFEGILIDTGAAKGSSAGSNQYKAYCEYVGQDPRIDRSKAATCHFGIGSTKSVGTASIIFPIGNLWLSFDAHVVEADTPILLSIDDMDRLGIYLNNLKDQLVHQDTALVAKVQRKRGHPFILWDPHISCMLTNTELHRLHRRFGHPSADKLMKLLQRAELPDVGPETRKVLEKIERSCEPCQIYAQKPRRFKFTLREDKDFNHSIYADVFYIDGKPVLHVVDEATNFQAAKWLKDMQAETLWRALRMCWIDVYVGPPDLVVHDAGKNFMANAFQANTDMLHIRTKSVPVESANSMTIVERYHSPIRRAYNIIQKECSSMDREECLQMAVKAINDSVGPDGLVPTLLVFGALPRLGLPTDNPSKSTFQRAVALRNATAAMSKHFAKRQVRGALHTRNGPDVTDIHKCPIGSPVLVYRPEKDKWEGPYSILDLKGEDVFVLTSKGAQKFRSTVVKPFVKNLLDDDNQFDNNQQTSHELAPNHEPNFNTTEAIAHNRFDDSRIAEFNGLMNRGVFKVVHELEAKGNRIYGSRFVDTIKNEGKPEAFAKSRLVVQAFNDKDHGLLTYAPTVQRMSQRLLLCLCAMDDQLQFFTRDVSQAYVQAETSTQRQIFVRPPASLNFPSETLLQVQKPLYGIPEAGLHWFRTYHNHHKFQLYLQPAAHDQCFLYTKRGMASLSLADQSTARGYTCLQTDDTASGGNSQFVALESKMSSRFASKSPILLKEGSHVLFNGARVSLSGGIYTISQPDHVSKLECIPEQNTSCSDFVSQRARGAYIAAVARPDLTFGYAQASQILSPNLTATKTLNTHIKRSKESQHLNLRFVPLDRSSIQLSVFCDASFASNSDLTSQLGYIIALTDSSRNANIIHYTSVKSKRVTRSVLAAELFAAVNAFDCASTLRVTLNDIFGLVVPLVIYTDSKSLFDSITGLNSTTEKRLLIDLFILRQNYELRELSDIVWIPSSLNPADAMTKQKASPALLNLMQSNKIEVEAKTWVERPSQQLKSEKFQKLKTRDDPRSHRST